MIKRTLFCTIAFVLSVNVFSSASSLSQAPAHTHPVILKVNDYYVAYTAPKPPYVDENNRMMIPLRAVSELLGAEVTYDSESKQASISLESVSLSLAVSSKTIVANGKTIIMDTIPTLYDNSMFIPVGYLIKALEISADWDKVNRVFSIEDDRFLPHSHSSVSHYATLDPLLDYVADNNAFRPLDIRLEYDPAYNGPTKVVIDAKNISGEVVSEGREDVNVVVLYEESRSTDKHLRERPKVEKDGIVTREKILSPVRDLRYILIQGRVLDTDLGMSL